MSADKLRGNPDKPSELTKLKALWRSTLSEEQKQMILAWRDDPKTTNKAARQGLEKLYDVKLTRDGQLSEFWSWLDQQEDLESTNELMENVEEFARMRNPDWPPEKVRQFGIEFFLARAVRNRDPDKFATIMSIDQQERFAASKGQREERKVRLAEEKFRREKKTKIEAGLDELAELLKKHPDLMKEFQEWRGKFAARVTQ